jgi:hypothetical protein
MNLPVGGREGGVHASSVPGGLTDARPYASAQVPCDATAPRRGTHGSARRAGIPIPDSGRAEPESIRSAPRTPAPSLREPCSPPMEEVDDENDQTSSRKIRGQTRAERRP